jgi:hypothetical protein
MSIYTEMSPTARTIKERNTAERRAREAEERAKALEGEIGTLKDIVKQMTWSACVVTSPGTSRSAVVSLGARPDLRLTIDTLPFDGRRITVARVVHPDEKARQALVAAGCVTPATTLGLLRSKGFDIVPKAA